MTAREPEFEIIELQPAPTVTVIEHVEPDPMLGAEIVSLSSTVQDPTGTTTRLRVRRYVQDTPATRWIIPHGLGRPAVPMALYDDAGNQRSQWVASHPELNRMIIDMDVPTAGAVDYI